MTTKQERRAAFDAAHPGVAEFLAPHLNDEPGVLRRSFLAELAQELDKFGELTDAQAQAVERKMAAWNNREETQ